jgi:hypothetical protein
MTNPAMPQALLTHGVHFLLFLSLLADPYPEAKAIVGFVALDNSAMPRSFRKTLLDERSLPPIYPTRHPTTNRAMLLIVADASGQFYPGSFFELQPTDQADNHRWSYS